MHPSVRPRGMHRSYRRHPWKSPQVQFGAWSKEQLQVSREGRKRKRGGAYPIDLRVRLSSPMKSWGLRPVSDSQLSAKGCSEKPTRRTTPRNRKSPHRQLVPHTPGRSRVWISPCVVRSFWASLNPANPEGSDVVLLCPLPGRIHEIPAGFSASPKHRKSEASVVRDSSSPRTI